MAPTYRRTGFRRGAPRDPGSVEDVASFESENFLVAAADPADLVEALGDEICMECPLELLLVLEGVMRLPTR